jgi:hypothetical protein
VAVEEGKAMLLDDQFLSSLSRLNTLMIRNANPSTGYLLLLLARTLLGL